MKFFYAFCYLILWIICHFLYPMRVVGREFIPSGPCIICANHSNYIDPLLLIYAFGLKYFLYTMSKKENLQKPVFGWIYRHCGAFPVNREGQDIKAVRTTLTLLQRGEKVVIFPEGTRTALNDPSAGKLGAVRFATKLNVPLLPVFITRNKRIFRHVEVRIGKPYRVSGKTHEDYETLSRELMEKIFALGETQ